MDTAVVMAEGYGRVDCVDATTGRLYPVVVAAAGPHLPLETYMELRPASRTGSILTSRSVRAAILLIILAAFVIRVYHLDAVGLENDEVFSTHAALAGFSYILEISTTNEPHPPLFYAFLYFWVRLAGGSEFALRFPSVVASVLTVAFLFRLASLFSWRALGLVAALLFALSPYPVYYAQDVRQYAPVTLLGIAAIYFALQAMRSPSIRGLFLYGLFMLLAIYTHYYAAFVFIFVNALVLAWMLSRRESLSGLLRWVVTQIIIVAFFVPWLLTTAHVTLSFSEGSTDPWPILRTSLVRYSVGSSDTSDIELSLALGFLAITIAGLWFASRGRSEHPRWFRLSFAAGYAFVPVTLAVLISYWRPILLERHLMISTPAFSLLLALGVVGLTRRIRLLGIAAALFLVGVQAFALGNYYWDARYAKTDLPDGAKYVLTHSRPGDAVMLDGWGQPLAFWYYNNLWAKQPVPSYLLPPSLPIVAEEIPPSVDKIMAQHQGVWLLDYGVSQYDPQHLVETYLARSYYQAVQQRVGTNRVVYYASRPTTPPQVTPLDVSVNGEILLKSFSIDAASVRPGEVVRLDLLWQALKGAPKDYAVSWRLLDKDGHIVHQRDAEPASGFAPTRDWVAEQEVTDRYGLAIPVSLPPGRYALTIVLYDKASGTVFEPRRNDLPLPGSAIPLAHIDVTDAPPIPGLQDPAPSRRTEFTRGGLRLLGYDLENGPFRPGQSLAVRLYWEAIDDVGQPEVLLRLLTDRGQVVQESKTTLGAGWFPDGRWPRGRIVSAAMDLPVPTRAESGTYALSLALRDGRGGESTLSRFASVTVLSRERSFTAPAPSHSRTAEFGGAIELLGYDLTPAPDQSLQSGQPLQLTLHWRALREMPESYKVFVHLVGPDGRIYGQQDGYPLAGKALTSSWVPGEILADRYEFPLRADAPAGGYKLLVGFYEPTKNVRLGLADGSGDSFVLADLSVGTGR